MPRLHIAYDVPGWAYYRRASALQRHAPADWNVTIGDWHQSCPPCDILLWLPYGGLRRISFLITHDHPRPVVVAGYNVGFSYRTELLRECLRFADIVIFNNLDNWNRNERPDRTACISNGVDLEQFYIAVPPQQRRPRALSIGSEYHYKHNDDLKGLDILRSIRPQLEAAGIECDWRMVDSLVAPKTVDAMRDWYNSGTVYVVASRCEGTPNPALEAAACGCVVVATPVGNMPELIQDGINGRLVARTAESLAAGIVEAARQYRDWGPAMLTAIRDWNWPNRAADYYALFRRLVSAASLRSSSAA